MEAASFLTISIMPFPPIRWKTNTKRMFLFNFTIIASKKTRSNDALLTAVEQGDKAAILKLLDEGADMNIRDDRSDNLLLYAGAEGMLPFVQAAIAAGADATITNRFGGTALIPAAAR